MNTQVLEDDIGWTNDRISLYKQTCFSQSILTYIIILWVKITFCNIHTV
jgi:hypothetical protein